MVQVSVIDGPGRPRKRTTPFPKYDVIERTFLQEKFNTDRWLQMVKPEVVRIRPFWLYDSIIDDRTTQTCRLCNGTLLPWDDPWWLTHKPPLHWGCRAIIRAVSRRTADRRGVTPLPTDMLVLPPFGTPPGRRQRSFTPEQKRRKTVKRRPPPPPPSPPTRPPLVDKTKFDAQLIAAAEKKKQLAIREKPLPFKKLEGVDGYSVTDADREMITAHLESIAPRGVKPLEALRIHPKAFNSDTSLGNLTADGIYDPRTVVLEACRTGSKTTKKWAYVDTSWTVNPLVSNQDPEIDLKFLLTHEYGHHVHISQTSNKVDDLIKKSWEKHCPRRASGPAGSVPAWNSDPEGAPSVYGTANHWEYWAESFTAYHHNRAWLKDRKPHLLKMVEDVLKLIE